jgi:hypothetical protein
LFDSDWETFDPVDHPHRYDPEETKTAARNQTVEQESVNLSLDYFKVFPDLPNKSINRLKNVLALVSDSNFHRQNNEKRLFIDGYDISHDGKKYRVFYIESMDNRFQRSLKVSHPDTAISTFLNEILSRYSCLPSQIEFTLDFILNNPWEFYHFLKSTIYVTRCGKSFDFVKNDEHG